MTAAPSPTANPERSRSQGRTERPGSFRSGRALPCGETRAARADRARRPRCPQSREIAAAAANQVGRLEPPRQAPSHRPRRGRCERRAGSRRPRLPQPRRAATCRGASLGDDRRRRGSDRGGPRVPTAAGSRGPLCSFPERPGRRSGSNACRCNPASRNASSAAARRSSDAPRSPSGTGQPMKGVEPAGVSTSRTRQSRAAARSQIAPPGRLPVAAEARDQTDAAHDHSHARAVPHAGQDRSRSLIHVHTAGEIAVRGDSASIAGTAAEKGLGFRAARTGGDRDPHQGWGSSTAGHPRRSSLLPRGSRAPVQPRSSRSAPRTAGPWREA